MSTATITQAFSATADVMAGNLPIQLTKYSSNFSLKFAVPDFQIELAVPITDIIHSIEAGEVILRAALNRDVTAVLTFTGELNGDDGEFGIKNVRFNVEGTSGSASTDFVVCSLIAMFGLADQVSLYIPEIHFSLGLRFNEVLLDISHMLRRRQLAYRIMVIEMATGHDLRWPLEVSGEEVETIAIIYHAIVERTFVWPIDSITVLFPATEAVLAQLVFVNQFDCFALGPDSVFKTLFGRQISLGLGSVTVLDKYFEDFDRVRETLARNDGQNVPVIVRSLTGQARYEFPNAPQWGDKVWEPMYQTLIDLEPHLDRRLTGRYCALAAATLSGLTDEEKERITARPDLDTTAFLID